MKGAGGFSGSVQGLRALKGGAAPDPIVLPAPRNEVSLQNHSTEEEGNNPMKKTSILTVLGLALAGFLAWAPNATAYSTVSNCRGCHSFGGSSSTFHRGHLDLGLPSSCQTCHAQTGDTPATPKCGTCHTAPGLPLHHNTVGAASCTGCHPGTPVPENTPVPGYNGLGVALDPCNGTEERFASLTISLDNDGDGLYDGDDPDCAAPAETDCFDGVDNDNDNLVDCADPDCAEASQITGCGQGACGAIGQMSCVDGAAVDSCTPGAPTPEVCDGQDNDCNGQVDDGIAAVDTSCGQGDCAATGQATCVNGRTVNSCTPGAPSAEVCDGRDNNCNGQVDDGIAAVDTSCGQGDCAATGKATCVGGQFVDNCTPGTPGPEICDGSDNNCNGQSDEGGVCTPAPGPCDDVTLKSTTCGVGECAAAGTETCTEVGGAAVVSDTCRPGTPSAEICDQLDNDCDGQVDEDGVCDQPPVDPCGSFVSEPTTCGTGACASTGTTTCADVGGVASYGNTCVAGTPTAEVPGNGIDENCNGMADDVVVQPPPTGGDDDHLDHDDDHHDDDHRDDDHRDDRRDRREDSRRTRRSHDD